MKKLITILCSALLLSACESEIEKKAGEKLASAQAAFERGDYAQAKLQIDSIKILYPKAFDARKAGQELMLQVELKTQQKVLASLDSAMQIRQQEFAAIKDKYILERDTAYQNTGNYLWPTQTVEKNMHRAFLRFQVDEQGKMTMTSIYCGGSNVHHTAVKVTAPDGSSAETPNSKDSYETSDLGEKIEKADYNLGEDGGVIEFLYRNKDKNIRVEYIGDKKFVTMMSPTDREALAGIYELSKILSDIENIKKEQEAANLKSGFVKKKMEINKEKAEKENK